MTLETTPRIVSPFETELPIRAPRCSGKRTGIGVSVDLDLILEFTEYRSNHLKQHLETRFQFG